MANTFKVELTGQTQEAAKIFLRDIDMQIVELESQLGLLQRTRAAVAGVFDINRPKDSDSYVKRLTEGATRRTFEGDHGGQAAFEDAIERATTGIAVSDPPAESSAKPIKLPMTEPANKGAATG